ncbi:MAG: 5-methylthioadenosine/S-adenosylhomocysteine nucleosidase [Clostridia bacterium]|nr:5-methylthioadenosine/S-adenosylhomocysteine nucleosidase [Clostridia bacterium]
MKTAIICAMKQEAEALTKLLKIENETIISGIKYYEGCYNNHKIIIAVCGEGKVHAAICAQTMAIVYKPDLMINLGVAGGIKPDIKTGDICIATNFIQYDYDLSAIGYKKGQISAIDVFKIPCDEETVLRLKNAAKNSIKNECIYSGTIGTGDSFISSHDLAKSIYDNFDAIACEMEGGSIAQVCYVNKIKFAAVRAISDNANEEASVDFRVFLEKAVENSVKLMIEYFK